MDMRTEKAQPSSVGEILSEVFFETYGYILM